MKATWSSCRILKVLQDQEIQMGPLHRMQQTRRAKELDENGTYTDKDEVAQYIYEYGHVPPI